jgi:hypothetical protein
MKKSFNIFVLLIFTALILQNCGLDSVAGLKTTYSTKKVKLSTESEIITFRIDDDAQYPHSMSITMQGEINGTGILQFGWRESTFYRTDTISNNFLVESIGGDWYNDSVIVKYTPITASTGELNINCEIHSSKK